MKNIILIIGVLLLAVLANAQRKTTGNLLELEGNAADSIVMKNTGVILGTSSTFVSGTGTAGTDNTAMTVITRTVNGGIMTQVGDRIRIRVAYFATAGASIDITTTLNGVSVSAVSTASTDFETAETWMHYIDDTHANILEGPNDAPGSLTALNVAGFDWTTVQDLDVDQNAVTNQHIVVFFIAVDFFPKGRL